MRILYDGEGGSGGTGGGAGGTGGSGGGAPSGAPGNTGDGGLLKAPAAGGTGAAPGAEFRLPDNWDYRTSLPPELKDSPSAKKYGNLADLVRGADNAQQLVGRNTDHLVEIGPNITSEAKRGVLTKLGLPEKVDAYYGVKAPKGAEQFIQTDHANFKGLADAAHRLGVMPDQFQGLVDQFANMQAQGFKTTQEAIVKMNADNVAALKSSWGEAFDGKVAAANLAVEKLGGEKLRDVLSDRGLGTDPVLLNAFAQIGEMLAEGEGGGDNAAGGQGIGSGMTPDQALAKGHELLQQAMNAKDQFSRTKLNQEAQEYFARAEKRSTR